MRDQALCYNAGGYPMLNDAYKRNLKYLKERTAYWWIYPLTILILGISNYIGKIWNNLGQRLSIIVFIEIKKD